MTEETASSDLAKILDERMPPLPKGARTLRLTIAVITRGGLAHRAAEAAADQYDLAGVPEIATRIRQAIEPTRSRGRQPTFEWAELRDWLVDDAIGILGTSPNVSLSSLMNILRKRDLWSAYSAKALEEQWRTFWKSRGITPSDALAEIRRRIQMEVR